jgi:hypothetical protein
MLLATPIGTEYTESRKYIDHRYPQVWDALGDYHAKHPKVVHVIYGSYMDSRNFPFSTVVKVVWYFDPNGKLEEIRVSRFVDAP